MHVLHLVEMGLTQGQNWVLDPLADACAADGRYTFLLDATPLPLTAGLGLAAPAGRAQVAAAPAVPGPAGPLTANPSRRRRAVAPPSTGPGARPGRLARAGPRRDGASRPVTAQCSIRACVSTRWPVRMPQNSKP